MPFEDVEKLDAHLSALTSDRRTKATDCLDALKIVADAEGDGNNDAAPEKRGFEERVGK